MGLKKRAKAAIEAASRDDYKPELVFVQYDDELTDEQVQFLLDDDWEKLYDSTSDWECESRWSGEEYEMKELIGGDDVMELEFKHPRLHEQLLELIRDHDQSDPIGELISHTRSKLYRVQLEGGFEGHYASSDDEGTTRDELIEMLGEMGLPASEKNIEALASLEREQFYYGGHLVIGVYADLDDMLALQKRGGTITDPHIFVWDWINGAAYSEQFEGVVTVPPGKVSLDKSARYGLNEICGLYMPAFSQTVTPNPEPSNVEQAVS